MHQQILRFRLEYYQLKNFLKRDALPAIVKTAPAGDAMEIAVRFDFGQFVEFFPFEPNRLFYQPPNMEIPSLWIKARNRAIVQHRPLQRKRLAGRQAPCL